MMTRIESQWAEALKLLLEQYKGSPKFQAIFKAVIDQGDHVEDLLWTVAYCLDFNARASDAPTGARLNRVGAVAIIDRISGESDSDYLQRIKIEVGMQDAGTPEEILRLVSSYAGSAEPYYIPEYPAGYFIYTPDAERALTQAFIDKVSGAGVQGFIGCPLAFANGDPIITTDGDEVLVVGPSNPLLLDGTWALNGSEILDGVA